ncbi:MAG: hypothetical protein P9L92_10420 [Candidatus Electryonea clarkiae]|nr:hypothetical protein [Candidatus Electryonea clarkiae]MDP8289139.1 hypothetical protein [Candidatus Electryonea clarkiae]
MSDKKINIKTGKPEFDNLYPMVKSFLEKDRMDIVIDGQKIRGYRSPDARSIWIRDYSDMLRAVKYFELDLKSTIDHFAETQAANGRIFDYFTTFPEKLPSERENWTKYVRVPVEADVEYRFVKAAYLAWQANGDDAWILNLLPGMGKALQYILTHPWRWDKNNELVKRPYTIDTWDFAYTAGKHEWLQFQINDDTFWGIMHGDNSGYYESFRIMALLYNYFSEHVKAETWNVRAEKIKAAMNKTCWNGSFYTHFVKLTPVEIAGVEESRQLSLSNPMAINRGVTTHDMAVSIIKEYQKRGEDNDSFVEWFSIDPPFPDGIFGDEKLVGGAYVNGGIMPLVGGELAKAAFEHGFEKYGVDILKRYYEMISERGETYLWYFPDGTPASIETSTSPEAKPTDGWGSSAMLYALIEGLAGIEDQSKQFQKVSLSPRWIAAGIDKAEVQVGYETSDVFLNYSYLHEENHIHIEIKCDDSNIRFHLMIPDQTNAEHVTINGEVVKHHNVTIEKSRYVDFETSARRGIAVKVRLNEFL